MHLLIMLSKKLRHPWPTQDIERDNPDQHSARGQLQRATLQKGELLAKLLPFHIHQLRILIIGAVHKKGLPAAVGRFAVGERRAKKRRLQYMIEAINSR